MKKPSILVVDDELFFRRLYAELLRDEGYRVEAVPTGEEAISHLQQNSVDIVLSDLIMPGVDGLEVLRSARSLDNPPEVILVTGHASLETAIQALKNGARDYLIKPFNPDELRHLVRTCIEQRRLLDENLLLKSQIQLFQKGQNLAALLDTDQLLPRALQTLVSEAGPACGFAMLLDDKGVSRLVGHDTSQEPEMAVLADSLVAQTRELKGFCALSGDAIPRPPQGPEGITRLMLFPLPCDNEVRGALVLYNQNGQTLAEDHQESLLFLAEQATLGFENAFRYEGARELIYADDLTGLYNYRYLEMVLDQEILRSERYGLEFSVVFIDLDHFKEVNDTHGHLVGSNALKEIATLLRESVREVDIVFRYGGDEFTALLVETDCEGAAVVSERIRRNIEQHHFQLDSGEKFRLTATVGFSTFPENAVEKKAILDLADQAMYHGKKTRNVARGASDLPE